ncbi:thiamine-phosphate kinase [Gloeobacter morelensis]|uniref:Thiamine-monophosphate kinase n=1 Tax=Gloeobacter morelensis MG652769 TaxID=2781736 RepID=A0ABY3PKV0_9CYAN|nr:thiamine-phosphate kinase [Gloeobacter morelensis]UFP94173.1 thiamine-phosphate kinase [Gloeobacter morelensis MG652769]
MDIAELGERGLIARLGRFFGHAPHILVPGGDDAAVVVPGSGALVATTDLLFEEVHFSDRTTGPFDVGWRSAAANLSDLAAMGATPFGMLVGLGLTSSTSVEWVEAFYAGFTACSAPVGALLLGGDTCRAKSRTVAVTALGTVEAGRILRRNAARPGDALVVTGHLGASRAGLAVLLEAQRYAHLGAPVREAVVAAHRRPRPRLEVPPLVFALSERAAAMDTSDGLTDAIAQVCAQSGCGAVVDLAALPIDAATAQVAAKQATAWALGGGEDYELLIALEPDAATQLVQRLAAIGIGGAIVGQAVAGDQVVDTEDRPLEAPGFEHFNRP